MTIENKVFSLNVGICAIKDLVSAVEVSLLVKIQKDDGTFCYLSFTAFIFMTTGAWSVLIKIV